MQVMVRCVIYDFKTYLRHFFGWLWEDNNVGKKTFVRTFILTVLGPGQRDKEIMQKWRNAFCKFFRVEQLYRDVEIDLPETVFKNEWMVKNVRYNREILRTKFLNWDQTTNNTLFVINVYSL